MTTAILDPAVIRERDQPLLPVLFCAWMLMLITFSAPGREGPGGVGGLDLIALMKVGARGLTICLLGWTLLQQWHHPRRALVLWCLFPALLYSLWGLVTVLWSPLRAVSIGQLGSLGAQLLISALIGLYWRGEESTSTILRHLCLGMLTVASLILLSYAISPDLSGLNREVSIEGSGGLFHPTSAGATGGLGLLLLFGSRLLWKWQWPRALMAPGLVIFGAVLWLAMSRTALILTLIALMPLILRYVSQAVLGVALITLGIGGALYLCIDPGTGLLDRFLTTGAEYVSRGESSESLTSLTGRTALWEAIWVEHQKSPLLGHGYFVTSSNGLLDVWSGPANRTAHNLLLQVLSSTGLIGLCLFLWAAGRLVLTTGSTLRRIASFSPLPVLMIVVGGWYLGWSQLCISFLGPVQPESIVFFSLLGIAIGQVPASSLRMEAKP